MVSGGGKGAFKNAKAVFEKAFAIFGTTSTRAILY